MTELPAPLPMLARYAIMVDVGYIYAAAGELLLSANSRREYRVDAANLIQALTKNADDQIRGELLRVYWYDAARDRVPTIDQRVIAQMPWVKLRLGNLNARGQQKGVDAQIRADMEALARHRAITDAVLVAGDEDMVPAVEAAQAFGVRVHLWGIEPPYGTNQAERLVWESDTVEVLDAAFVKPYFSGQPVSEAEPPRLDIQAETARTAACRRRRAVRVRQAPRPHPQRNVQPVGRRVSEQARAGQGTGGGSRGARRAEVGTDPRRGQHQGPAARANTAAGDRQGTAGGGREGARPVAAAVSGGQGVAAGRGLGAGAPAVRHRRRNVTAGMTGSGDPAPVLRVVVGAMPPRGDRRPGRGYRGEDCARRLPPRPQRRPGAGAAPGGRTSQPAAPAQPRPGGVAGELRPG